MAPPADSPVTNTRAGSEPWSAITLSTMDLTDAASPLPRVSAAVENQLKQRIMLLALDCWGNTTSNCQRSASAGQPECV